MADTRYARQIAFAPLGEQGQRRLAQATVLVVGCGGLGAAAASALARAGVGRLRLVDDDRVEPSNLHRQVLYDEADLGQPKVTVAARRLQQIDTSLAVEQHRRRLTATNVSALLGAVTLVIDGSDQLPSRDLLNAACLRHGVPWIYGGVEGATGMVMTILPRRGPCFSCAFPRDEDPDHVPGPPPDAVLGPAPAVVGAIQAVQACRVLAGDCRAGGPLLRLDLWEQRWQSIEVARDPDCPACGGSSPDPDQPS